MKPRESSHPTQPLSDAEREAMDSSRLFQHCSTSYEAGYLAALNEPARDAKQAIEHYKRQRDENAAIAERLAERLHHDLNDYRAYLEAMEGIETEDYELTAALNEGKLSGPAKVSFGLEEDPTIDVSDDYKPHRQSWLEGWYCTRAEAVADPDAEAREGWRIAFGDDRGATLTDGEKLDEGFAYLRRIVAETVRSFHSSGEAIEALESINTWARAALNEAKPNAGEERIIGEASPTAERVAAEINTAEQHGRTWTIRAGPRAFGGQGAAYGPDTDGESVVVVEASALAKLSDPNFIKERWIL